MWTYLIDTDVVSEVTKPRPNAGLIDWMASVDPEECCLSVITMAELRRGLVRREAKGGTARAARIGQWLESIADQYQDRVLPVTPAVAHAWAHLPGDRALPDFDSLIAATAIAHDLTVVTRNARHFEGTGVRCLDPFNA